MDLELSGLVRIITDVVTFDWFNPHKKSGSYQSIGTGFFIDENGYILTCAHVVNNAIKISIVIPAIGKDKFDAEVISTCASADIALLKATNYKNKTFLKLGDSDKIKPKDKVTAIGYPLGQDRLKYTSGIVSGIQGSLIQTDAPINAGNSGGPLLNENNMVVGINSSKIASSKADNIGYAVPMYEFNILKQIMYEGKLKVIRKPTLLTYFNNIDPHILSHSKSLCKSGYLVKDIYEISKLYKAGLRIHDILCSFDGFKLDNFGETKVPWSTQKVHIKELISRYKIGNTVKISFWSDEKQKMITSNVHFNNGDSYKIKYKYPQFENIDYEIINGCIVMELTINHLDSPKTYNTSQSVYDNLIKYYDTENRLQTVLIITKIFGGSYMKKVDNIDYGEILQTVNKIDVNTLNEFRAAILKPIDDKFIIFQTENNNLFINTIPTLVEEEIFLSNKHSYPLSKIHQEFINSGLGKKVVVPYVESAEEEDLYGLESGSVEEIISPNLMNVEGREYWLKVLAVGLISYIIFILISSSRSNNITIQK